MRAPPEDGEQRDSDQRDESHDRRVPSPAALRTLPRLLNQRLDQRLQLVAADRVALIGGTGWGRDAHAVQGSAITLLLLALC